MTTSKIFDLLFSVVIGSCLLLGLIYASMLFTLCINRWPLLTILATAAAVWALVVFVVYDTLTSKGRS